MERAEIDQITTSLLTRPTKLDKPLPNGFICIACTPFSNGTSVVLGARDGTYGTDFVTWRRNPDGSCDWGHYDFDSVFEALDDFRSRSCRGY